MNWTCFFHCRSILWLEGDDNVMFVSTYKGIFMVHLQSMQFEKIFETGPVSFHSSIYMLQVIAYICIASIPKSWFFSYNCFVEYPKSFNIGLTIEIQSYIHTCNITWLLGELLIHCFVRRSYFSELHTLMLVFLVYAIYVTCINIFIGIV